MERIVEWQQAGRSRPITYELDMTNVCNSKCPFCFGFLSREKDTSSMSLDEVRDIIRQVKAFGGKGLTFTGGGEPLCNPATIDAVAFAREIGLDVGFITNGILLDEKKAAVLADCCTWVRVSFDAGSHRVYLMSHGLDGDTFERVQANTRVLVEQKRKRGSSVCIGTGFLTFRGVEEDMLPYVRISRDIGVDYAQFRPLLKSFNQKEFNDSADDLVLRNLEECQKLSDGNFQVLCSLHKYTSMQKGELRRSYAKCHGHHFATVISANRKMYLCCHMRGIDKYCLGDLRRNTLEEIWHSEQRRKVCGSIDFDDCPLLCRCDGFNALLWNISQKNDHENFL
jgi:sulfatase maturation enzyme AslB (radical SAM superfamily)